MSRSGDFNLQLTEAMQSNPKYNHMTPQEAIEAGLDISEVVGDTYDRCRAMKLYNSLEPRLSWESRTDITAFVQWAEGKLLQDGAWDDFFDKNNTTWETEEDGKQSLVFSGDFEGLAEQLFEEFEKKHGAMSNDIAGVAIGSLTKRLDEAWTMDSIRENRPDHLGEAINRAFDDYRDVSLELIESEREIQEERNREIERSINAGRA